MKNSKNEIISLILGMLLLFELLPIQMICAAETVSEGRTVRVAFPLQAGMSEENETGDLSGYNYDYLEKAAEYAGWNLEYITFDNLSEDEAIVKAMEMVQNGEADLMGTTLKNEYAESIFDFPSENYGVVYTTLLTLESTSITETNYFLTKPLRVAIYKDAVKRNAEVVNHLDSTGVTYELIECDTQEAQYQAVKDGKADVLSAVSLNRLPNTRTVASFAQRPYYFVTAKGNTALLNELDEAIHAIDYSRPYFQTELQYKYFGPPAIEFALTEEETQILQKIGTLNVLCVGDNAPYVFEEKDGSPTGLLVSVLDDFAKQSGLTLRCSFCEASADVAALLKSGDYDCVIGVPLSSGLCAETGFVGSYPIANVGLVTVRKDTMKKAFAESTIGVCRYLANAVPISGCKEVILFDNTEQCLDAVRKGEIDLCCGNRSIVEYYNYESTEALITTSFVGYSQNVCIDFSKKLGLDFLNCANNYIRSLTDITKNSYLSEANYHLNHSAIAHFIHTQPLQAVIISVIAATLLLNSLFWSITAVRRKKRNAELARANAAKTDFLSRISHDMRTPMNGILGLANLMKDKTDLKEIRADLDQLQLSGTYLLNLINDTLDMNRIESGKLELHPIPVDSRRIVKNVVQTAKMMAAEKGIELEVNIPAGIESCFPIVADTSRLEQITMNLVSNAIKYTPEKGKVALTMERISVSSERVVERFMVRDNGIGMSEQFLPHLFEPFSQEGRARTDRESGSGLGMSIVKQIVAMMNGEISVQSELDKGTTITMEIPFERFNGELQDKGVEASGTELKGKRVLLCEDHPLNAQIAKRLLEKVGVVVDAAENGQVGLDMFSRSKLQEYDAVLMDLRMPVMDGMEATRAIRLLDRSDSKSIPIIAMTANAFDDDVKACLDAGMNAHLAKPVEPAKLYETLAVSLDKRNG